MPPDDDKGALLLDMHTGHVLRSAMAEFGIYRIVKDFTALVRVRVRDLGMMFGTPDIIRLV